MSELKYASASDEEVMEKIRERIKETKQLLSEIRDMLKVR
jgi:predicted small metal-binding protein